jgi:hypothetical protein
MDQIAYWTGYAVLSAIGLAVAAVLIYFALDCWVSGVWQKLLSAYDLATLRRLVRQLAAEGKLHSVKSEDS